MVVSPVYDGTLVNRYLEQYAIELSAVAQVNWRLAYNRYGWLAGLSRGLEVQRLSRLTNSI